MSFKYTCAMCGKEFTSTRTDEEATEEYERRFGGLAMKDRQVVCEPCYKLAMVDYKLFEQIVNTGGKNKTNN